jgi:hypothetical protein
VQLDLGIPSRIAAGVGLCLSLTIATPAPAAAPAAAKPAPAAKPAAKAPAKPAVPAVDPNAVKALRDMSAFLQTLSTFQLVSQTSLDVVTNDGQLIQLDGETTYKVRKPDAFIVTLVSDTWNRQYIYNGHEFTLSAPKMGYYATVPAPATIRETLDDIGERFGISLPLDDLFRWSGPDGARADSLTSGALVGPATVDGVKTNHYAFREGKIDWQIWIQQGDQPLPRKVVIVDRRDPAGPGYTARLAWTLNPPLTDADFTFRPANDATRIRLVLQP